METSELPAGFEDIDAVIAEREARPEGRAALERARQRLFEKLQDWVRRDGLGQDDEPTAGPCYGIDPSDPNILVQVLPDGTRTRGRFVNRQFVAVATDGGEDKG